MIHQKIKIWAHENSSNISGDAVLTTYIHDNTPEIDINRTRAAILICPGGGYGFVSDREDEPVAIEFLSAGFNVFTLRYDVAPKSKHPQPLLDVSKALWIIRQKAEEWHVDPDKIAVCGFSAGGHLAASLGVHWNKDFIGDAIALPFGMNKPNALILCYPVITSGEHAHRGSFVNLLGEGAPEELFSMMSLETQITQVTPPAFIWHTYDDGAVPVENALLFATALRQNNIPFEMHIFDKGFHGLALCSSQTSNTPEGIDQHIRRWTKLCIEWLNRLFV